MISIAEFGQYLSLSAEILLPKIIVFCIFVHERGLRFARTGRF